jgi:cell division protein FtsI (penicillin-binding protein 3)
VAAAFILLMALLALLLARVQIVQGSGYAAQAKGELDQRVTLQSVRGAIYDRDGDLLAVSVPRYDVVADDYLISGASAVATKLGAILHLSSTKLLAQLSEQNGYVVLAKQVDSSVNDKIENLDISGISTQIDTLRVSPGSSVFQPLLGGVNAAGQGDAGLEYEYNSLLSGKTGTEIVPEAPGGAALPGQPQVLSTAVAGENLILSLDEPLQVEVTKDVTAEMASSGSDTGLAVVEDVQTGAILAMVDLCRLRNGVCASSGPIGPALQNLAVTAVYEPGSVMKLATISYAMHYHLISPTTSFSVPYSLNIGGYTFEDADLHPTEQLQVKTILAQSSNIGTIEIERLLGAKRLGQALASYGFGLYTGLNWPGESPGLVSPSSTWEGATAPSVAIGTGEAVTPLQVLDAYTAVANGGVMTTPSLVTSTVSASGKVTPVAAPKTHRVIDATTASEMVPMFEGVVQDGTAVSACVPGYTVAGKTGTAQAPYTNGQPGYIPGDWNGTFVGFVPAEAPKLSAIVSFNRLNNSAPIYGGSVAAPVFAKIMGYALRHFDIAPPVRSKTSQIQCSVAASAG